MWAIVWTKILGEDCQIVWIDGKDMTYQYYIYIDKGPSHCFNACDAFELKPGHFLEII
jgi:negative regulator of sigma E activity